MASHPDVVTGPDVAIVGWVPRIEPTVSSLPTGYQQCPWPWSLALLALFASGNPDPSIQSDTDFQNLLSSQEFRVAVALRNITAEWSGSSDEGSMYFDPLDITIGYTPLGAFPSLRSGFQQSQV